MLTDARKAVRGGAVPYAVAALSPAWRAVLIDLVVAGFMVSWALWPTVVELAESWQRNGAYRYAWLVAPMFVYLVGWHYRAKILAETPQPDVAGVIVASVAALGWSAADAANIDLGRQLALILVCQGLALAALGRSLYRRLFPVMALLFLMLPSGDLLVGPLRWVTLKAVEGFAWVCAWPYRSDGFLVQVGAHSYLVLEACAGLAQVTLTLFLGYCFAVLVFRSIYRIVALAVLAALLGVLSNVLRVDAIVWIDQMRGVQMGLSAHGPVQWLALLVVLAALFYGMLRLRAEPAAADVALPRVLPPTQAVPQSASQRRAPLVAGAAVLAIVALTRVVLDDGASFTRAVSTLEPPAALAAWQLETPADPWVEAGELRHLALRYRGAGRELAVVLVETRVAGAKLLPERVLPEAQADWRDVASEPLAACDGGDCVRLVHTLWKNDEAQRVRHVYYAYSIGSLHTSSRLLLRLATAAMRLAGQRDPARLVAFSVDGDALRPGELYALHRAVDGALRATQSPP